MIKLAWAVGLGPVYYAVNISLHYSTQDIEETVGSAS